jgi:hypothetical protein
LNPNLSFASIFSSFHSCFATSYDCCARVIVAACTAGLFSLFTEGFSAIVGILRPTDAGSHDLALSSFIVLQCLHNISSTNLITESLVKLGRCQECFHLHV